MGKLEAAIDALKTVSIVCGMVPLVGENLKSAVELASAICEKVQTMKESRSGYQQLGIQAAELIKAIARVLEQGKQDETSIMKDNVEDLRSVLRAIEAAVDKRLLSDHDPPVRKRDRLLALICRRAKDVRRMYKDPDDLEELRQKFQNVMDNFKISSLLRTELSNQRIGITLDAVNIRTSEMHQFQVTEAERSERDRKLAERDANIALLKSLGPIASAAWNAPEAVSAASAVHAPVSMCVPGTRVSLLESLMAWTTASDSRYLFWLSGLAGTGKSTIARTLCERLHDQGSLGASFFISRDQSDRRAASSIVCSIACQLAVRWPSVLDALCAKLRGTPADLAPRSLQDEITDFIITPALELPGGASLIIVIDALDEAFSNFDGRPGGDLLLILGQQLLRLNGRVRLFITSRNEKPIQQMFDQLSASSQEVLKLHDLDHTMVQDDITTYLNYSLDIIRKKRLDPVVTAWPSTEAVRQLVELSGLLFVYAATVVRFIDHRKYSPRERLAQFLGQQQTDSRESPYAQLDGLYRHILSDAVGDSNDGEFLCERLQAVLAVIVLAETPLDIEALSILSGVSPDNTRIAVDSLSSLLADSASGVRVFHPSFPDFILDASRISDSRLRVVPTVGHELIALRCVEIMNSLLRYNICNVQDPTVANKDLQDLDVRLRENVSDALRYAACFWCNHLTASDAPNDWIMNALNEFCQKHLCHWVEILSLLRRVGLAEAALLKAIEWCAKHSSNTTSHVTKLLQDLARVLRVFTIPLRSHALHVYHSAFVTMPQCGLLDTLERERLPSGLPQLQSPRAAHWGPSPRVLEGYQARVRSVAFSPDGKHIVSASEDRTVRVWSAVTFEQLAELKGHHFAVNSVAFSPDGTHIVSGSDDWTVRIWDAVTFEQLAELEGHVGQVKCVAFSPDGTRIVSGSRDFTVRVWNAVTFQQLNEVEGHAGPWGRSVASSPDGTHGHEHWVMSVAFSPDGTHIVSGSRDCTVRVWNAVTFEQLAELKGHEHSVHSVAFSPDGTHIVSGSNDRTVRVWSAVTFEQLVELKGHEGKVLSVAFSPDGTHIVSGSGDHTVRVWNAVTFEHLDELKGHENEVISVAFSPDGTHIVSGSLDCTVRVWNAVAFEQLAELKGHEDLVSSVAFSPDGTHIVSGSRDCTVRVWNAVTFEQLAELKGHEGLVFSVAFSPDGTHIVSGSGDYTVRVWNAITFEQLAKLKGHVDVVSSVAFSPDGTHIVSGSGDHTVRVWSAVTFEQLSELKGHECLVMSVAFSPDGIHIVSGSEDGHVRVWNAATFELMAEIKGHTSSTLKSVAFSHRGNIIHASLRSGEKLAWTWTDNESTIWTECSPIGSSSSIACPASSADLTIALSHSGWLSCSYAARRILLWLPVERRGFALASHGRHIVIGAGSGAVTVLELPTEQA